jgi:sec-independent protein translocase protein TatB
MNILNIGIPELLLIFVIALIVLGPRNMVSTSRQLSKAIRKFITSNTWKSIINSTQEIRNMQDKIINDTGLPETLKTLQNSTRDLVLPSQPKWNSTPEISISSPVVIEEKSTIYDQDIKSDVTEKGESERSSSEHTPK